MFIHWEENYVLFVMCLQSSESSMLTYWCFKRGSSPFGVSASFILNTTSFTNVYETKTHDTQRYDYYQKFLQTLSKIWN